MLDFSEAFLSNLSIHQVGNKSNEEGLIISEQEVPINGNIGPLLTTYFTRPFKPQEFYNFSAHPSSPALRSHNRLYPGSRGKTD